MISLSRWNSRLLFLAGPLILAALQGCPASATQFGPVMADSTVMDTDPTPSPDGAWLAFTSERGGSRQIWVRPIDGGEARQITREPDSARVMTPTWARDSKSILFVSTRTRDYNVYAVPFEGGESRPMSDFPASNRFAAYSPDGKQIAFPSNRLKPGQIWGFDLYLMDAAGEKTEGRLAKQLTHNDGSPGHPTWSPDGKWIAYVAKPIDTTKTVEVGPGMSVQQSPMFTAYHLWKIPAAGGKEVLLSGKGEKGANTEEIWPTWSPDGKWIAVQRRVGAADDVWLYEIASGNFHRVTTFGDAGKPTWSPDGKSIWFVRVKGKDQDIWRATHLTLKPSPPKARRSTKSRASG